MWESCYSAPGRKASANLSSRWGGSCSLGFGEQLADMCKTAGGCRCGGAAGVIGGRGGVAGAIGVCICRVCDGGSRETDRGAAVQCLWGRACMPWPGETCGCMWHIKFGCVSYPCMWVFGGCMQQPMLQKACWPPAGCSACRLMMCIHLCHQTGQAHHLPGRCRLTTTVRLIVASARGTLITSGAAPPGQAGSQLFCPQGQLQRMHARRSGKSTAQSTRWCDPDVTWITGGLHACASPALMRPYLLLLFVPRHP